MKNKLIIAILIVVLCGVGYFFGYQQYICRCERELVNQDVRAVRNAEDAVNSLGVTLSDALDQYEQGNQSGVFEYARAEAKYTHILLAQYYHQGYDSVIEREINRDNLAITCDYYNLIYHLLNEIDKSKLGESRDYEVELLRKVTCAIYGENFKGFHEECLDLEELAIRCDAENPIFIELKNYLMRLMYQED